MLFCLIVFLKLVDLLKKCRPFCLRNEYNLLTALVLSTRLYIRHQLYRLAKTTNSTLVRCLLSFSASSGLNLTSIKCCWTVFLAIASIFCSSSGLETHLHAGQQPTCSPFNGTTLMQFFHLQRKHCRTACASRWIFDVSEGLVFCFPMPPFLSPIRAALIRVALRESKLPKTSVFARPLLPRTSEIRDDRVVRCFS